MQTAIIMGGYTPPEWGVNGANPFEIFVETIKGGVLMETLALPVDPHKSYILAGTKSGFKKNVNIFEQLPVLG